MDRFTWAHPTPRRPPAPPAPLPGRHTYAPRTMSQTRSGPRCNHALHGTLTLLTGGLWAPVWIKHAYRAANRQRQRTTRHYYG